LSGPAMLVIFTLKRIQHGQKNTGTTYRGSGSKGSLSHPDKNQGADIEGMAGAL